MKKLFLALLLVFFSCHVALAELKGDFLLEGDSASIKEGDLVEGTLKVWPIENADHAEFSKLQNTTLFNSLQLIQIHSIEPSANNADVLELKGTFLARAAKYLISFELNYKGELVQIPAPSIKIFPLEQKSESFFILTQSLNLSYFEFYLYGGILLLVLLIALVKRRVLKKWLGSLKKDPRKIALKHFGEMFGKASTREDFELIYSKKDLWLPLITQKNPAYNDFFKVMNQHQYKPRWGQDELNEVKSIFEIIRGSFK